MFRSKSSKDFCETRYKSWVAILFILITGLIVWVVVGFDKHKTAANLDKLSLENNFMDTATDKIDNNAHVLRLQESYSGIAIAVKAVTVNISATRRNNGALNNNNRLDFADPFGGRPQQFAPMAPQNIEPNPGIIGVKALAPPITRNAVMPHEFRGECAECHLFIDIPPVNKVAAQVRNRASVGSGVIVDSTGYILTNYHIVSDADDVVVTLDNGRDYAAIMNYTDVVGDLAILKINANTPLPAAVLGDSDLVQEGDIILAVGNPFGLSQTVTSGIISNTNRTVSIGTKQYSNLIQTDAAINKGSSGGPLVNMKGEIIGINTAIYSMTGDFMGIGFAVPINRAKDIFTAVPSLGAIAANVIDMNVGDVITLAMQPDANPVGAWFGIEAAPLDTIMVEQFGLKNGNGIIVNRVFPDSPAERVGLKRGDVVLKINGRSITSITKFQKITSTLKQGEVINLVLSRKKQEVRLAAALDGIQNKKIPAAQANKTTIPPPGELEWAGIEVMPITPQLAVKFGVNRGDPGVVVVEAEGIAAAAGIMNGDVIRGINKIKINNMSDFADAVTNVNIADGVLFDVSRRGEPLYITM